MKLTTFGRASGFDRRIVVRVSRSAERERSKRADLVLTTATPPANRADLEGYRALLTTCPAGEFTEVLGGSTMPMVHSASDIEHLRTGDVVTLTARTGRVRTVYRPDSRNNTIFTTDRCNSFCLMCSQPPVDRDDSDLVEMNLDLIRLMEPPPAQLGITGGEPTLLGEGLLRILGELKCRQPDTHVHMLTNGRRFAWPEFTTGFMAVEHPRLSLGIPLYSETAWEHDYVVQARGAFDQTIQGLHQLARHGQAVEIRVVLHALTIPRLRDLAEYIYRNLSFAVHVALMGLEITGFTKPNLTKLWVDPCDYQDELQAAVEYLVIRGMNVSIYNHQLCVLPRPLWKFARKSISDWKNIYLDVCQGCSVLDACGGLFKSAEQVHSRDLHRL
jgi:His-Xaa-Ser system radical SAM maturase HxsC